MSQRSHRIARLWIAFVGLVSLSVPVTATPARAVTAQGPTTQGPYGAGYWLAQGNGAVVPYGDAPDLPGLAHHAAGIVGVAATPGDHGYILTDTRGGVFTFGDARFFGSMGPHHLNAPIVGVAYTPTGKGYYLVGSDGGVFTFGDAHFHGSMGGQRLNKPMVGIAVNPTGSGYWLVAADGGIFTFGDAHFRGSAATLHLSAPITSMASSATGKGYWMVGRDGAVYAFGDAPFYGSLGFPVAIDAVTIARSPSGRGYLIAFRNGSVVDFGDAASCSEFLDLPSVIQPWQQPQTPLPGSILLPSGETPDTIGLALPFDPSSVRSMLASTCHGPSAAFTASTPWHIDFHQAAQPISAEPCDIFLLKADVDATGHFITLDGFLVGPSGRLQVRSAQMAGQHRFRVSLVGSCYAVALSWSGGQQSLPFRFGGGGDSLPFSSSSSFTIETPSGHNCDAQVFDNRTGRVAVGNIVDGIRLSMPAGSYYVRSNVGCAVVVR